MAKDAGGVMCLLMVRSCHHLISWWHIPIMPDHPVPSVLSLCPSSEPNVAGQEKTCLSYFKHLQG